MPFKSTLPRYREYNGKTMYLELHANRTGYSLNNPETTEEEFLDYVRQSVAIFEKKTNVDLFLLGRSGRHVCVLDTPENSKRYQRMKNLALQLEKDVVFCCNKKKDGELE